MMKRFIHFILLAAVMLAAAPRTGAAGDQSLTSRARRGEVKAMVELARFMFERDNDSMKSEGLAWLNKAAVLGSCEAQWRLAMRAAEEGDWAARDRWLEQAKASSDYAGLAKLGVEQLTEGSRLFSPDEGMQLLERSVGSGSTEALLTALHYEKHHLKKFKPGKFLHIAVKSGNAEQLAYIGTLLSEGLVFMANHEKAAQFFEAAIRGGYRPACISLASAYAEGLGRPKNALEASAWLRLALTSLEPDHPRRPEAVTLQENLILSPDDAARVEFRVKELAQDYALDANRTGSGR